MYVLFILLLQQEDSVKPEKKEIPTMGVFVLLFAWFLARVLCTSMRNRKVHELGFYVRT